MVLVVARKTALCTNLGAAILHEKTSDLLSINLRLLCPIIIEAKPVGIKYVTFCGAYSGTFIKACNYAKKKRFTFIYS